jgi:predicted nucleotidyltransferase
MRWNSQRRVAQEAARLMVDGAENEYLQAKERAMLMLGLTSLNRMPSNREVRQWIGRLSRMDIGEEAIKSRLREMRLIAAEIMAELDDFDPYLIGSTLAGNIRENSDVDLHAYCDHWEEIKDRLIAAGYEEAEEELVENRKGSFIHIKWLEGNYPVEISLHPWSDRDVIPISSVTGKPMKRVDLVGLQRLLQQTAAPGSD